MTSIKETRDAIIRVSNNESYNDRIEQVVSYLETSPPVPGMSVDDRIAHAAEFLDVIEYRFKNSKTSSAWREFARDVKLAGKGRIKKKSAARKLPITYQELSDIIGNSFPGDPFDAVEDLLASKGIQSNDMLKLLNSVAKSGGDKSYIDTVANLFDDFVSDNPDYAKELGLDKNPWR